jgi:hypothetical protein
MEHEKTQDARFLELLFFMVGMLIFFRNEPAWVPLVGGFFVWIGMKS